MDRVSDEWVEQWLSQDMDAGPTVQRLCSALRELLERRAQRCETCEHSYCYDLAYASGYVQCTQIWDAPVESHQEVENTHYCGWWRAKEGKDE